MKKYTSIPTFNEGMLEDPALVGKVYLFDKIDGSNIRAEWNSKKGFYKFGSRNKLISDDSFILNKSINLIKSKEGILSEILKQNNLQQVVLFFEFFGPNSCFGQHKNDDEHEVKLIDCSVYKKGYMSADKFVDIFGNVGIPNYKREYLTENVVDFIQRGLYDCFGREGVVVKGKYSKSLGMPFMAKIKRHSWYDELRTRCATIEEFDKLK